MKKFKITINGKSYEVEAEILPENSVGTPCAAPAAKPIFQSHAVSSASVAAAISQTPQKLPSAPAANAGDIVSPLAGKIVAIDAKAGQTLSEGERVLTMEAMKMNTFVVAPKSGVVKEILVEAGQAVEEGATLVRME